MSMHPAFGGLRKNFDPAQFVVVVGSGVSIAATGKAPAASWKGLIDLGIDACRRWDPGLPAAWAARKRDALINGDREEFLGVADEIGRRIGTTAGRLGEWLRETVGALPPAQPEILDALHALGCPLVTTNYDGLLARAEHPAVSWRNSDKVGRILRGVEKGIIHLHGHWEEPESIVLSLGQYLRVRDDPHAAAVRQALSMTHTLLFVGCGDGLSDPNFRVLRDWMGTVNASRTSPHYRLCTDDEHAAVAQEHDPEERIDVVPYGRHEDLVTALQSLAAGRAQARAVGVGPLAGGRRWLGRHSPQ